VFASTVVTAAPCAVSAKVVVVDVEAEACGAAQRNASAAKADEAAKRWRGGGLFIRNSMGRGSGKSKGHDGTSRDDKGQRNAPSYSVGFQSQHLHLSSIQA
jgi:hypothetical protein